MLFFIVILLITILLSFITERFLKPKTPQLTFKSILLHSFIISALFLIVTLIVQRPVFSGLAVFIFHIILVVVSNAKLKALKEPMVFSDIAMFSQAFKHPRLYFPFLGLMPVIIAPLIIVGLIYAVLTLEPAIAITWQRIISTLLTIGIFIGFIKKMALKFNLSLQPENDNARYGLLNSLITYTFQSGTQSHKQLITKTLKSSPFFKKVNTNKIADKHPNITVIQSESFFDARRLHPSIKSSILKNFDDCNTKSAQYGKLKVPAWGANTMRTEFSFLTGLSYADMGLYRFYPYQFLSKMSLSSIASWLSSQGYYCICIHPHPASFFGRERIFSKMGFDEFIDIESFNSNDTFGPYISDQAVTNKIIEVTKQKTDKPLFIFAITMENHGPLHLEKTDKSELNSYYSGTHPKDENDLTVYLRHLKNADQMIKTLCKVYSESDIETTVCFYGDHVPSMPNIYQTTNYHDEHSDYFIWHSKQKKAPIKNNKKCINVESLAMRLLDVNDISRVSKRNINP